MTDNSEDLNPTDTPESLDLFSGMQYVYGEASLDGEIQVTPLSGQLEEPTIDMPIQIDREIESALHTRIESTVEMLDASLPEQDTEGQLAFIDRDEWWKVEWHGMPSFCQDDIQPLKTLIVHFRVRDDLLNFSRLLGQRITQDTKTIWYPEMQRMQRNNLFYVDEESAQ